ncbi:tumor susceptibility gene 101 protein [Menidia menidia]|uniref:(Atlantic silverside) hypothetical protein n=1 Tax=Menidia menidia TaxID=238744 RepID=A0A8S4BGX9_9TELE|nr:unnamed protein product [Menidia menidia]
MSFRRETIRKMLPKKYLRKHVAHEIHVAITYFKNLVPVMDRYVYNDGTAKNMMSLTGTVPVVISDRTYNIPISLWIEENYPLVPPVCYVNPTREMMIVRGKYISSNGEVQLPYLDSWNGQCDLVSLLQVMVAMFGEFPPVCKQPYPGHEQTSCSQQLQRKADGSVYLSLSREDDQPFKQENETSC